MALMLCTVSIACAEAGGDLGKHARVGLVQAQPVQVGEGGAPAQGVESAVSCAGDVGAVGGADPTCPDHHVRGILLRRHRHPPILGDRLDRPVLHHPVTPLRVGVADDHRAGSFAEDRREQPLVEVLALAAVHAARSGAIRRLHSTTSTSAIASS
ncbi:hypothetical protein [Streptomyces sp. NPDC059446]|uniref:hypothetical protein n=1 Tax=Streptomyces sp. NPDC059446 TaxID=3346833 RepID=UPI0036C19BAF